VAPVGTIDGRVISTERGPMVERLQQLYLKALERDVASRARP
jgi:branched-chain amino acid aminotransferase